MPTNRSFFPESFNVFHTADASFAALRNVKFVLGSVPVVGFVCFVIFVGFKMKMSSSLGVAATVALAAVCVEGGLETIEAQDFIECTGTL